MGRIIDYVAKETQGKPFRSYKYCFDTVEMPHVLYEEQENSYTPLKDYAENVHDPNSRDIRPLAINCMNSEPLFRFFLDGSRKVYKVDDIQYDNKVYPVVSGQIAVACCERMMKDDNTFSSFKHFDEEIYSVLCLPVKANMEGVDNNLFFNNLCKKIQEKKTYRQGANLRKVLYYPTQIQGKETLENKAIAKIQDDMI